MGTDSVSETLFSSYLDSWMMDKVQKPSDSNMLLIISVLFMNARHASKQKQNKLSGF
jgi:hypothetical protein